MTDSEQRFEHALKSTRPAAHATNPYERFANSSLILRDHLAIDRTALANERTLLAYGRTSLALILTGAGVIRFFGNSVSVTLLAWGLILLGIAVALIGGYRSATMARNIRSARAHEMENDAQLAAHDHLAPSNM
ncbi:MAG: DUF202 domain-containing protein [Lentisphaerae bacterium]|nr:DUF202 domain-containing protein [Lentisphaerota bacterium]